MDGSSAIMELLRSAHHIDKDATLAVNSLNSPVSDVIWQLFSDRNIWIILYVAVLVMLIRRLGWKRALAVVISLIVCVVACDQLCNLVKHSVQRLRPMQDGEMLARGLHVLASKGGLYGFFSAHAANTAGFAVCSWMGFRNDRSHSYKAYGMLIALWSLLVGMSRVFVGKHYLGDVLVGLVVGALIGWLCASLARLAISKLKL